MTNVLLGLLSALVVANMAVSLAINARLTRVLAFVVGEFTPDSGTSLRDVVDRIELAGRTAKEAADLIARNLDRADERIRGVARNLDKADEKIAQVKTDLGDSRKRADKVTDGTPGEAADAGAQNPKEHP